MNSKDWLKSLLYRIGIFPARATPPSSLSRLIQQLRPRQFDGGLIRLGPASDGGYLIPNDLDGIRYCFSPGVADESGFEVDLASRGIKVFMADASVDQPGSENPNFSFLKMFVGAADTSLSVRLDTWKRDTIGDYEEDLLLQMDIEGAEYEALLATSPWLISQFRIMVIEFHHLDRLLDQGWFEIVSRLFERLLTTHAVVHLHPNNCCGIVRAGNIEMPRVLEVTFYRRDRLQDSGPAHEFPHPLDIDNTGNAHVSLPAMWYEP